MTEFEKAVIADLRRDARKIGVWSEVREDLNTAADLIKGLVAERDALADKEYIERGMALQILEKYMTNVATACRDAIVAETYLLAKDHAKDYIALLPAAGVAGSKN